MNGIAHPPMTILNRLRSAESGSRELDGDIALALGQVDAEAVNWTRREDGWLWYRFVEPDDFDTWEAPPYTTSIDAALALVERMLPDALYDLHKHYGGQWAASVLRENHKRPYFEANSAPLAILTALFSALEAKDTP